jgi:type II secretory pathway component PulF
MASEFLVIGFTERGGRKVRRAIQAESSDAARGQARAEGIFPTKVVRVSEFAVSQKHNVRIPYDILRSVHVALSAQLSTGSGVVEALASLSRSQSHRQARWVIGRVRGRMLEGEPLSSAMACFPRIWPHNVCAIVRAGERTGSKTGQMFKFVVDYNEEMRELRNMLVERLTMPALSIASGIVVIGIFVFFTLPRLATFYRDLGVKNLPWLTDVMIRFGRGVESNIPEIGFALVVLTGIGIALYVYGWLQRAGWAVALRTPVLRQFLRAQAHAHFCTVFSLIFKATNVTNQSLEFAASSVAVPTMRRAAEGVIDKLNVEGQDFVALLRRTGEFDAGLLDCMDPADVRPKLDAICDDYSQAFASEARYLGAKFATVVTLVSLAVMVCFVVLAIVAYGLPLIRLITELSAKA